MHGDECAAGTTGGDPRYLTACRHRWRRRTSSVPHSHGLGRWGRVEGSLGALIASLPWDLPGKVPACGAAAPLVMQARKAHHRTGPTKERGGGNGWQVAVLPRGVAHNRTRVHGAVLAWASLMKMEGRAHTWRFPGQAAQGMPPAVKLGALHSLHFLGPEGADSIHPSPSCLVVDKIAW